MVIVAAAAAVALLSGVEARRVVALATALATPLLVVALAALSCVASRRSGPPRTALFCDGVAAELRAGASLRGALNGALRSAGRPGISRGAVSADEVAAEIASEFEDVGEDLAMTVESAARAGGASADLFDEISSVALAESEISHEVRIASAPARATAVVFLVAPFVYVAAKARSEPLAELLASPAQRLMTVVGAGLFLVGLGLAVSTLRRAR